MLRMGEYKKRRQQKEEVADRFARTQVGRQKGGKFRKAGFGVY